MEALTVGGAQLAAALRDGFVCDVFGDGRYAHALGDMQDRLDDQAVDVV
jgi:hypothetical protein